jgi:nucleoside-diphosphate kinase
MKTLVPQDKVCWDHYNKDEAWFLAKGTKAVENLKAHGLSITKEPIEYGKDIIKGCVDLLTSGPCVAMVWEGNQSIAIVKKLVGGTEPTTSDVGTIRGDFTLDSYSLANIDNRAIRNLVHCTDNLADGEREINLWFKPEEIINYRSIAEEIFYDVNIDGILE